jgi:uncharacterized peroxidase-related enzyme
MTAPLREIFTIDLLGWAPWMPRATETDLPAERREMVEAAVADNQNNAYIDVLCNDFASWKIRHKVHRHVYTSADPGPSAWRELGATAASRVNGCVFCASVHARMWANFSGDRKLPIRFLEEGVGAELPPTERAIADVAAKLTLDPESLTAGDLQPLRDLGFDDIALLDVLNYAAFFNNANRLMLSLGEPTEYRR